MDASMASNKMVDRIFECVRAAVEAFPRDSNGFIFKRVQLEYAEAFSATRHSFPLTILVAGEWTETAGPTTPTQDIGSQLGEQLKFHGKDIHLIRISHLHEPYV